MVATSFLRATAAVLLSFAVVSLNNGAAVAAAPFHGSSSEVTPLTWTSVAPTSGRFSSVSAPADTPAVLAVRSRSLVGSIFHTGGPSSATSAAGSQTTDSLRSGSGHPMIPASGVPSSATSASLRSGSGQPMIPASSGVPSGTVSPQSVTSAVPTGTFVPPASYLPKGSTS